MAELGLPEEPSLPPSQNEELSAEEPHPNLIKVTIDDDEDSEPVEHIEPIVENSNNIVKNVNVSVSVLYRNV